MGFLSYTVVTTVLILSKYKKINIFQTYETIRFFSLLYYYISYVFNFIGLL